MPSGHSTPIISDNYSNIFNSNVLKDQNMRYKEALFESRVSFRKSVICDTFEQVGMKKLLAIPHSAQEISLALGLNQDAVSRFLYAAASLGLITQEEFGSKFHLCSTPPKFSEKSSLTLISLINSKIPDILIENSKTIEEILELYEHSIPIRQILEDAVKHRILERNEQYYSIPEETKPLLVSTSPDYIGPMVEYLEKIGMPTFTVELLIAGLQSGQSQWQKYLEEETVTNISHPFALYSKYPDLLEKFTFGLHKMNEQDNRILVQHLSSLLNCVKTVLDIGGGSGCLALAIANQFPEIVKIDIYELPEAIPTMKHIYDVCSSDQTNIHFIAGSFRESNNFGGLENLSVDDKYEAITLSWILHDWSDHVNIEILKKAYVHLKSQGMIVIIETILPDNRLGKVAIGDMTMLLHTEGRERTFAEYKKLLEISGFRDIVMVSTNTNRQAIIGYKLIWE